MVFKIYKVTNLLNNKIYIGQTHYDNPKYFGSGTLINKAIEKYGIENFIKEYIDEAKDQNELDEKEMYWIKTLESQNREIGYNIADGGWNYFTMTDEIKKKISISLKGKYVGENAFRHGIKLTPEHIEILRKHNKGKKYSSEFGEAISKRMKGVKRSDETRKKMSASHTGKVLSEDTRKKISERNMGRICSEETREILRNSNLNKTQIHSRIVIATSKIDGIELNFNNISEAARYFNVTRQRIKLNTVENWIFVVNEPKVSIKLLKNTHELNES